MSLTDFLTGLVYFGSGAPSWDIEHPNFGASTLLPDNTSAVQAALNAAGAAGGGIVSAGFGTYNFQGKLIFPANVSLVGRGEAATTFRWTIDLGAGAFALDSTVPQNGQNNIRDLTLQGPGSASAMDGLRCTGGGHYTDMAVQSFRTGLTIRSDHEVFTRVNSTSNYVNLRFADSPVSLGNQTFVQCLLQSGTYASIVVEGSNIMTAVTVVGSHLGYGPYAIVSTDGPTNLRTGVAIQDCTFTTTAFELACIAILDQSTGAGLFTLLGVTFDRCQYSGNSSFRLPNAVVTDGSTTADSTTVSSVQANFTKAHIGGTISGGSIPAGATITGVSGNPNNSGVYPSVVISSPATVTAGGVSLTIGRGWDYTFKIRGAVQTRIIGSAGNPGPFNQGFNTAGVFSCDYAVDETFVLDNPDYTDKYSFPYGQSIAVLNCDVNSVICHGALYYSTGTITAGDVVGFSGLYQTVARWQPGWGIVGVALTSVVNGQIVAVARSGIVSVNADAAIPINSPIALNPTTPYHVLASGIATAGYPLLGFASQVGGANSVLVELHPEVLDPTYPAALFSALPAASATYRGRLAIVEGNGTTTADILYACLESATGTFSWKQIVSG